jgi:hypothetical protein
LFLNQIPYLGVLGKRSFFNLTAKMDDCVEAGIFYIIECIHVSGISLTFCYVKVSREKMKFLNRIFIERKKA